MLPCRKLVRATSWFVSFSVCNLLLAARWFAGSISLGWLCVEVGTGTHKQCSGVMMLVVGSGNEKWLSSRELRAEHMQAYPYIMLFTPVPCRFNHFKTVINDKITQLHYSQKLLRTIYRRVLTLLHD